MIAKLIFTEHLRRAGKLYGKPAWLTSLNIGTVPIVAGSRAVGGE